MQYRTLGSTGLRVSVIGLGTWQFGGEWGKNFEQSEVDAILSRAADLGINLVDTAECYGEHLSESLIGRAIEGRRDRWIVATKFGHQFHGWMQRSDKRTAADVGVQLEDSLRALGTDYIDLYQFHSVRDSEFFNEELWEVLRRAKQAGKIRYIGNSIASGLDPAPQAQASTRAGVESLQIVYNRLDRSREPAIRTAAELNLGVLARVPLASGFLSGKYRPGDEFAPRDYRSSQSRQQIDQTLAEVQRIAATEVPPGVEMAQWALAWCLKNPAVSAVIPGCKDIAQLESNARASEVRI